jgi:hypothetical protein
MFRPTSLTVLTYANGFTLWHYASPDPLSAVHADGYFNSLDERPYLQPGDMIVVSACGGDGVGSAILTVTSVDFEAVRTDALAAHDPAGPPNLRLDFPGQEVKLHRHPTGYLETRFPWAPWRRLPDGWWQYQYTATDPEGQFDVLTRFPAGTVPSGAQAGGEG